MNPQIDIVLEAYVRVRFEALSLFLSLLVGICRLLQMRSQLLLATSGLR